MCSVVGRVRHLEWMTRLNGTVTWFILAAALTVPWWASAAEPADEDARAREILSRADRIRFPAQDFQVDVVINTSAPDAESDERAYQILSKGNNQTLVQTTAPAIDRNQILLMRDHDLWAFL